MILFAQLGGNQGEHLHDKQDRHDMKDTLLQFEALLTYHAYHVYPTYHANAKPDGRNQRARISC